MSQWLGRVSGFCALTLLWGLMVWFALPVDLPGLSLPSLALLHLGPPVSVMAVWSLGKGALTWRARRKADQAAQSAAQEEQTRREAERTEQDAALRQRQAYLECRGIFLELVRAPEWFGKGLTQAQLFVREAGTLRGTGGEATLEPGLRQIFASAFLQSAAIAWLPVYIVPRRGPDHEAQLEWVRNVWRQAASQRAACFEGDPPVPDCQSLPGAGPLAARVLARFDADPDLPALILLGADSPLGDAPEDDDLNPALNGKEDSHPGHAVAALVLSRPGLVAREADEAALACQLADPYLPYWERERLRREADRAAAGPSWGKLPVSRQADFCALKPFAAFHRPDSAHWQDGAQSGVLAKRIQTAIETVSTHAALRDPPPGDGEAGKDDEPQPLDVGWLAHNSGCVDDPLAADRLVCVARALNQSGGELDLIRSADNLAVEHGDVGAAGGVLMLAGALCRAGQLQKPVLMAEFRDGAVDIGVARPAPVQ